MKKPSAHSACALLIVLAFAYALAPTALAQTSAGTTHLTQHARLLQSNSDPSGAPLALTADSRPIKVDVSLVLVSVSVVDALNREVAGLNKEDFRVFEGKEEQTIRHFSSEDAPISLGVIFDVSSMAETRSIERVMRWSNSSKQPTHKTSSS